jgi:hypothetical protein
MNFTVKIDWKFVVALGVAVSGVALSLKVNPEAAAKALTHAVDACKELMVARNGNH